MCLAVHWRLLLVECFTAFPVCLLSFDLFSASVYGEPISEALELYSSEADSCGPVPGARVWPPGNRDAEFGAVGQDQWKRVGGGCARRGTGTNKLLLWKKNSLHHTVHQHFYREEYI